MNERSSDDQDANLSIDGQVRGVPPPGGTQFISGTRGYGHDAPHEGHHPQSSLGGPASPPSIPLSGKAAAVTRTTKMRMTTCWRPKT